MEKHTPWQLLESLNMWYVRNSLGEFVLPAGAGSNYYPTIVEAVNNHDALTTRVEELESLLSSLSQEIDSPRKLIGGTSGKVKKCTARDKLNIIKNTINLFLKKDGE